MTPPHDHVRPSRRDLLLWGGGTLAAASLTSCSFLSTDPSTEKAGAPRSAAAKGKEAPSLAKLAADGKLPKLEERLPKNPVVLQPTEKIGTYGGTWRCALLNASDTPWLGRTLGGENLFRWDPEWNDDQKGLPNVAEKVEASADGRVFTITLREGLKWSDGEPFTADDVVFSVNDVAFNEEINPVTPYVLLSDDERATIKKLDDYTVEFTFSKPTGLFMARLATEGRFTNTPLHYLKQFHKKYNPDVEKLAKQEKYPLWKDLYGAKADGWANADKPTLNPWKIVEPLGKGNRVVAERNPYYWKTDPDGSQLPYLDRVTYDVISEPQVILLKATNGELDFTTRHINSLLNKPVLARDREKGKYHFIDLRNTLMNDMVVALNLNHKNPVLRKIFQNKDFRIGLSHAINREEMIKSIWQRQGEPWQAAPAADSEFYDEEFAKQYIEYDVAKANEYLDKAGLTQKDGEGFRLRPDGKRLTFQVEVASPSPVPFWVDGTNAVCEYWKKVGVDAKVKNEDRSLFYERKDDANEHDATVWSGDGGLKGEMLECRWYFPFSNESNYAELWRKYFESRGTNPDGEKPPPETLKQMEIYWQLLKTPDAEARKELFRQILQISKEQFYAMGVVRVAKTYGIVKNNFRNVPKVIPEAPVFNTPYPVQPAQFFIE
ncbi:ABC transporter substrate-binding protein [Actinopolymorpha alba]|uniref:ABC transporter substrate-binding protein n=1 Tax=Actinopolymorpha alba TaxID=533267 RepID=UPI000376A634|nr:ABC transporter substrate-binding protein [Actinopolymorpha alba]